PRTHGHMACPRFIRGSGKAPRGTAIASHEGKGSRHRRQPRRTRRSAMDSLPEKLPRNDAEAFTGLVCPDCSGNVVVRIQERHVALACRIGRAYSIEELVGRKEAALEERMWAAVFAFEELGAFLTALPHHDLTDGFDVEAREARATLALQKALVLRSIIET